MLCIGIRRRLILPGRVQPSTFSAEGLNFCVRDGNRWDPFAIATGNRGFFIAFRFRLAPLLQALGALRTLTTAQGNALSLPVFVRLSSF